MADHNIFSLPNEILLDIFPYLALRDLIAAQGVCRQWRLMVHASNIHSARRMLLQFYMRLIRPPVFLPTRPYIVPHLRKFDRLAFVGRLPNGTPDDFKYWILEWPAKAIVGWIWPGLPVKCPSQPADIALATRGENVLGYESSPNLCKYTLGHPSFDFSTLTDLTLATRTLIRWRSNFWSQGRLQQAFGIHSLYICSKDPSFSGSFQWVHYVVDVTEGGESILGTVNHFDLGDNGRIADSWIGFLEHELDYEEWDYSGGRQVLD